MLAAVFCAVRILALLSPVWTSAVIGRFVDDLALEGHGLSIRTRLKRQSCSSDSFICKSGQCIDFTLVCNGAADCKDSSDETRETCRGLNIRCPGYAFTCDYGGCVDGDAACDGKFDCADLSDEKIVGCNTSLPNPLKPVDTQGSCKDEEFQCNSGECVDFAVQCNGATDCPDSSDETAELCRTSSCPGYAFTCAYGGCIDDTARCDGKLDCADGSDEDVILCEGSENPPGPGPGPGTAGTCYLPSQPSNGRFIVGGCEDNDRSLVCRGVPGTSVQSSTLLNYNCEPGFVLDGAAFVVCLNGKLSPATPTCRPVTCPPLESTTVSATCTLNGEAVDCNGGPSPVGTKAILACQVSYQMAKELSYDTIQCAPSGQWNPPAFSCTPVCGTRNPDGKTFLANGREAKVGEFPWMVAIYRNSTKNFAMSQDCGGSLINERLVVSAAHCFWDPATNTQKPKELYKFAIGKYFRDWETKEPELQVRDAKNIVLHSRYRGRKLNYADDIAVIVLNVSVQLTWAVRPICVDWKKEHQRFQFVPGTQGEVAGWGITEKGEASPVLMTTKLPFVDFDTCWKTVPRRFQSFVTRDKFCAGYTNGTSVCPGDSGGGLAFERNELLYLQGIVSVGVSPEEGSRCYTDQYTAFTIVADYLDFIKGIGV